MNDMSGGPALDECPADSSFRFTGSWREFLPIALTNFALTVVTLGFYRFWAKARERRYLWSRTHFIDDAFEWTGTGKEMFLGFLIVAAVLMPVILFVNFGFQAMVLRGQAALAGAILLTLYVGFFYLYHVAKFRALRYRLSRTWWHGIRGGSDAPGWDYGWKGLWKSAAGWAVFGFLVPWSMTQLWNDRWNRMSFGGHPFKADAHENGLMRRWLLLYLVPVLSLVILSMALAAVAVSLGTDLEDGTVESSAIIVSVVVGSFTVYGLVLLFGLSFYTLFFRQVAAATSVGGLSFVFTARTRDWLKLVLGNIGLVIATLGVGLLFLSYRNWAFVVRHMEASGVVDLDLLTQSTARAPTDAEGLADAFDFGAV
ncbi:YjgN family protein [Sphingomonas sp. LY54]|uniref:YjgN family protein n=1 Tax=Sphingomonas sp. LY54 TaxID=3095343 RepID=UPI002D799644|nr:YjgN family protein [Sphingomonas sp. LY54]WRP27425.1 YjgN family protein [Sphingomonas sp. LY54]